eukprot:CAMPEP_0172921106 /NCGR_PEP_ID=MMETSP1075-20121228/205272_1 /TAXON_ID=2916 /ORGANISM="Ceratium fusus, Strain PA161109" /LENGTH=202 /DNA_ID=CAMNT_0013781221 /DNA_START=57 /DNA_END=661 /DNA_ORIENTATION=-
MQNVDYVECQASSWALAADGLIQLLTQRGVGQGQVLGVDAHSSHNGEGGAAVFCAHYSMLLPSLGILNLRYMRFEEVVEDEHNWATISKRATSKLSIKRAISVTASSSIDQEVVLCCFYYSRGTEKQALQEVSEVVAPAWKDAAERLITMVEAAGLCNGQVQWIDAYWLPFMKGSVALSAYFCRSLHGNGPLRLSYSLRTGG